MRDIALRQFDVHASFKVKRSFEIVSPLYDDADGSVHEYDDKILVVLEHQSDVEEFINAVQTLIQMTSASYNDPWVRGIVSEDNKRKRFRYYRGATNLESALKETCRWATIDQTPFLRVDFDAFSCSYEEEGCRHIAILCVKGNHELGGNVQNEFAKLLGRTPSPNAGRIIQRALT